MHCVSVGELAGTEGKLGLFFVTGFPVAVCGGGVVVP